MGVGVGMGVVGCQCGVGVVVVGGCGCGCTISEPLTSFYPATSIAIMVHEAQTVHC